MAERGPVRRRRVEDRVIGPLSNLPELKQAFACPADAPMVRPAEKRCEVW